MQKHPGAPSWRLIGTKAEGTFCHKPCTVSGGGKSEISKSLDDAVLYGPIFVDDLSRIWTGCRRSSTATTPTLPSRLRARGPRPGRKPLSPERSLGSVIKLLTPSPSHTASTTPGSRIPPRHAGPDLHDQASLPSGVGRRWRTASRSTRSTARPGTSSRPSGDASWRPICGSGSTPTASGGPSSCARTSSPPRRSRWRTTSPPRWWCRRVRSRLQAARSRERTTASSSPETASTACSSGRTTPSSRASTSRPS
jgi:hypothetical protein